MQIQILANNKDRLKTQTFFCLSVLFCAVFTHQILIANDWIFLWKIPIVKVLLLYFEMRKIENSKFAHFSSPQECQPQPFWLCCQPIITFWMFIYHNWWQRIASWKTTIHKAKKERLLILSTLDIIWAWKKRSSNLCCCVDVITLSFRISGREAKGGGLSSKIIDFDDKSVCLDYLWEPKHLELRRKLFILIQWKIQFYKEKHFNAKLDVLFFLVQSK